MTIFMTEIDARLTNSDSEDDPVHEYCDYCYADGSDPQWAFCGAYIGDQEEEFDFPDDAICVLCIHTEVCPRCGTRFPPGV